MSIAGAQTGDPVVDVLLDYTSVKESDGNYDAWIGHIHGARGTITGKTLGEVYQFQRELVAGGAPSSAVGRYQFVQRTLSACAQACGVGLTQRLDARTQDQLGLHLLQVRGLAAWRAGAISDSEFAHRLSCEWASLPDPENGGRSHYDGDGVNRAGRTLESLLGVLEQVKGQAGG